MMNSIKAVLFDIDDTLFDRDKVQVEMVSHLMREFPELFERFSHDELLKVFLETDRIATEEFDKGADIEEVRIGRFRNFLRILCLNEDLAEKLNSSYLKAYPLLNAPMDDVEYVLEQLSGKYQLGIVSNGSPRIQHAKLDTLGIRDYFECVVISEELGYRKPDPRIFLEALRLLSRKPEECVYVGNLLETDILGAKNAGLKSCWLNRRDPPTPMTDLVPDYEIKNLRGLLEILRS
jgi:HAD superfamily hydrolase (TIGR02253 family)